MPYSIQEREDPPPNLITIDEAAQVLGIKRSWTNRLIRSGRIQTVWVEGTRMVVAESLNEPNVRERRVGNPNFTCKGDAI